MLKSMVLRSLIATWVLTVCGPAWALTLSDVVRNGGFTAPNETIYSDFKVRFKGGKRISRNLEDYSVTLTDQGFAVRGSEGTTRGDGRMIMKYIVSARTELPIAIGGLGLDLGPDSMLKAKRKFRNGKKKLGKIRAMPGQETDSLQLGPRDSVRVKDVIFMWRGFPETSSANMVITVVPEPATGLMFGAGLAVMAGARARRRRTDH